MAKRKRCTRKYINEATLMQAYSNGQSYFGVTKDVVTRKGTVRKDLLREARCQGLRLEKRQRGGYETEVYLVPIKGRRRKFPLGSVGAAAERVPCRDGSGAFVPVSQCKGPVCRDGGGRFVSCKEL